MELGEMVLRKDAEPGHYRTGKGRIIEVIDEKIKTDHPKPHPEMLPYKYKDGYGNSFYGWIKPDYPLYKMAVEECKAVIKEEVKVSKERAHGLQGKRHIGEYYLICPNCFMESKEKTLPIREGGIQKGTCEVCGGEFTIRACKESNPVKIAYFINGKQRIARRGRKPRSKKEVG